VRKYQQGLLREVEQYPGVTATFEQRGKHPAMNLHYRGRHRFVMLPLTPSDGARGFKNTIRDVRKELRNLGVTA
jgi:hypothetical protein